LFAGLRDELAEDPRGITGGETESDGW
jgi:hypothetical protein